MPTVNKISPNEWLKLVHNAIAGGKNIDRLGKTLRDKRVFPRQLLEMCQQIETPEAWQIRRALMEGLANGTVDVDQIDSEIIEDLQAEVDALNQKVNELTVRWENICAALELQAGSTPEDIIKYLDKIKNTVRQLLEQNQDLGRRIKDLSASVSFAGDGAFFDEAEMLQYLKDEVESFKKVKDEAVEARHRAEEEMDKLKVHVDLIRKKAIEKEVLLREKESRINDLEVYVAHLKSGPSFFARIRNSLAFWINSLTYSSRQPRQGAFNQFIQRMVSWFATTAMWAFPSIIKYSQIAPNALEVEEDAPTQEFEVDLSQVCAPDKPVSFSRKVAGGAEERDGIYSPDRRIFALSHIGGRKNNEDGFEIRVEQGKKLILVADGMGGYGKGEVASRIALETVSDMWDPENPGSIKSGIMKTRELLMEQPELVKEQAGTCMAGVAIGNTVRIFNVGDTRVFRIRGGRAQLITKDAGLATKFIEADFRWPLNGGELKDYWGRLQNHNLRNVVTTAIYANKGSISQKNILNEVPEIKNREDIFFINPRDIELRFKPEIEEIIGIVQDATLRQKLLNISRKACREKEPDIAEYELDAKPGDIFIVCSDGLTDYISYLQLIGAIQAGDGTLKSMAQNLRDIALQQNARDNITVAVVEV